jgi:hypothetical protein
MILTMIVFLPPERKKTVQGLMITADDGRVIRGKSPAFQGDTLVTTDHSAQAGWNAMLLGERARA